MSGTDYWTQVLELSRKNSDAHKALLEFLDKNPRPNGLQFAEYDELAMNYVKTFDTWIGFCEANAQNR
ncbi:hypothetical protein GV729_09265 [Pseudomonas sp. Fl4BN2]|nr:hypothetical protein [Pseudomonas sp. Fl4BN2]